MKLFLKWALINSVSFVALASVAAAYSGRVHGAPLAVAALILAITAVVSGYAGVLCWRLDRGGSRPSILHDAEHVRFAVDVCQLLGLVGAAFGFYIISTAPTGTPEKAVDRVINGLGGGLAGTITGVVCSLILALEYHLIRQHK